VINIDIIQNKEFSIGYPYNSPIDSYFASLTPEFISNYNIEDDELFKINEHKRATKVFDAALFSYMNDVSVFIKEYSAIKSEIVSKYDEQILTNIDYKSTKAKLEEDKALIDSELLFMEENKEKLEADLSQTEELISYYETQLKTYTIVDPLSQISELNSDIVIIDETLATISKSIAFYLDNVDACIVAHVDDIKLVSMYSFDDVLLKKSYESWIIRNEEYYTCLAAYYKDEYESKWTAGTSIMYDKNMEYVERSKQLMIDNSNKLASEYIKEYNFNIEKTLKLETINLIETEADISPSELQDSIIARNISLLHVAIEEVSSLIIDKQFAIDSIVSPAEFKDYNMYKELIQLKRYYISSNIGKLTEPDVIDGLTQYDSQIAELKESYSQTEIKLGEKTYLNYFYDFNRTKLLLNELTHSLNILELTDTGVILQETDVDLIEDKIATYTTTKDKIEVDLDELNKLNSLKVIDKIEINDSIALLESNILSVDKLIKEYIQEYTSTFKDRLSIFNKEETTSYEKIKAIVIGKVNHTDFLNFAEIKEYSSTLKWWNEEDRNELYGMYENILSIIESTMELQWKEEFKTDILNDLKFDFYDEYIKELIFVFYAEIVQYINYKEYNETIEADLKIKIDEISTILDEYVVIAKTLSRTIEIPTLFYDYTNIVVVDTDTIAPSEVKEVIMGYIMNNYNYLVDINLSYRLEKIQKAKQLKVDLMWENMEMKNG